MKDSNHLKDIYETKKGAVNLQVVFSDIIDYSKRKSTIQKDVIDNFTKLNQNTLEDLSKKYIKYAQENDINIDRDIIKIPTGDGLAVIFSFEGLQSIHLDFARMLLEKVHEHNISNNCDRFKDQGWCNCHDNFNLRIGISEGKGIIYKNLNENYNVAGNVINMASRVMSLGDNNSVILTEKAHESIIDMTSDTTLEDDFELYEEIRIKHGLKLNVYQYRPKYDYINNKPPKQISENLAIRAFRKEFGSILPIPPEFDDESDKMIMMNKMSEGMKMMQSILQTFGIQKPLKEVRTIEAEVKEKKEK